MMGVERSVSAGILLLRLNTKSSNLVGMRILHTDMS